MDAESAIDLLRHHGPLALVLLMALNRLGFIPGGMLVLITVGALSRQGAIPLVAALVTAYLGAMIGDTALYGAGRFGLGWLSGRVGRRDLWSRAHAALERWGGPAVFLTRWLILPLTIAVSLLCGINRYSYRSFAAAGAVGNLIFVVAFVGVGYRFGAGWQSMADWSRAAMARPLSGALAFGLVAAAAALLAAWRFVYRRRLQHALAPREVRAADQVPTIPPDLRLH